MFSLEMMLGILGFILKGVAINFPWGMLFINFSPLKAKSDYKKPSYIRWQIIRILGAAMYAFILFDVLLFTVSNFNIFALIVIPALIVLALSTIREVGNSEVSANTKKIVYQFCSGTSTFFLMVFIAMFLLRKPLNANKLHELVDKQVVIVDSLEDSLLSKNTPLVTDDAESREVAKKHLFYWGQYGRGWNNFSKIGSEDGVIYPYKEFVGKFKEEGKLLYVVTLRKAVRNSKKTDAMETYGTFDPKTREYIITKTKNGLISSSLAKKLIINSGLIKEDWTPVKPLLFSLYGKKTYLFPVYDAAEVYQGIALVQAHNSKTIVVFGKTINESFMAYSRELSKITSLEDVMPPEKMNRSEVLGKVTEINSAVLSGTTVYYVKVDNVKGKIFTVNPEINQDIVLTDVGEEVKIKYIDMDSDIIPVESFGNPSVWE